MAGSKILHMLDNSRIKVLPNTFHMSMQNGNKKLGIYMGCHKVHPYN